jgi:hypothetical protein
MLASLWATVMILASDVDAPWMILFELVAAGAFLCFLLQFLGTGLSRKGYDKHLKEGEECLAPPDFYQRKQPPLCASVRECPMRSANGHSSSERRGAIPTESLTPGG